LLASLSLKYSKKRETFGCFAHSSNSFSHSKKVFLVFSNPCSSINLKMLSLPSAKSIEKS
jgi:hypothetical protein